MTRRADPHLDVRLAKSEADLIAAGRLRYRVFVEELGGDGPLVDHANRIERDEFDPFFDHLVLVDGRRDESAFDHVVGVYRLMPGERVAQAGRFYSEDEYDLEPLKTSGLKILELGRSCIDPSYRGGLGLFRLWQGLAEYIEERDIQILFGVASFHGASVRGIEMSLSYLHHSHLAPPKLRVRAREEVFVDMNLVPPDRIDRIAAMRQMPALIKSYLRLGGFVGEGAFIDTAFNTVDVCLVVDVARVPDRARLTYGSRR